MHVFYCKKCKKDSLTPICEHCGQPITALSSNERFKWRAIRVPLGDARSIWGALKVLALAEILLILFCFIGELLVAQDKQMALTMLTGSGMLPWALVFFGLGAMIILLCLGLQGREEMHYVLDKSGAHLQKWIEPGRIRCYARFLPYESYNIAKDNEGNARMLIGESHILWEDVCRYEVNKRACRIDLYRPAGFRFMTLYPEREELDAIVAYITPKMKQLVRR